MESAEGKIKSMDSDYITAKRSADHIIHVLSDFIPDACRREAWDTIGRMFLEHGVELTTKEQRKIYEEMMKLTLSTGPLSCPPSPTTNPTTSSSSS